MERSLEGSRPPPAQPTQRLVAQASVRIALNDRYTTGHAFRLAGEAALRGYPSCMTKSGSTLYVPLRSNAKTLVTGTPIAALRRRLKYASILHDQLVLEPGALLMKAGPQGWVTEPRYDQATWQTPRQRHVAEQEQFGIRVRRKPSPDTEPEPDPGAPPREIETLYTSNPAICWAPTLLPFADELPGDADWVHFAELPAESHTCGAQAQFEGLTLGDRPTELEQRWTSADERNTHLRQAITGFVARRTAIINANKDLATAIAAQCTITMDPLHSQVVSQRFKDKEIWNLRGYSIPILFPRVGDWSWQEIASLRRDPNMTRFRAVIREIEDQAAAEAAGGDIEAAARHVYEQHLASALPALANIGTITGNTIIGFAIGTATGLLTIGITGPGGPIAGAAIGVLPGTILGIRNMTRQRKSAGWIKVRNRIS